MPEVSVEITQNIVPVKIEKKVISVKTEQPLVSVETVKNEVAVEITKKVVNVEITRGHSTTLLDARYSRKYVWTAETADATETEMLISSAQLIVGASEAWLFNISLIGTDEANQDSTIFKIEGGIKRDGADNTSIIGEVSRRSPSNDSGAGSWIAAVTADDATEALKVTVTGEVGKNIKWRATGEITKIEL